MELTEDGCTVPASWADAMLQGFRSMQVENARVVALPVKPDETLGGLIYPFGRL